MAKDDWEVIEYKILKYMYECLKHGKEVELSGISWSCPLFDINKKYWFQIIRNLVDNGYIEGMKHFTTKDGETFQQVAPLMITRKGREYLLESKTMNKVNKVLGATFEVTLSAVLGTIIN